MQAGGNQDRNAFDRLAGFALHHITWLKQQAGAGLSQPALAVDPLSRDAPQRQPEHTLLPLLPAQPQAAASLHMQHRERPELADAEVGSERAGRGEQLTAVMPQSGGYSGLPATEVIGLQHGGQPSALQRILTLGLGGGTGQGRRMLSTCPGTLEPGGVGWNDKGQEHTGAPAAAAGD